MDPIKHALVDSVAQWIPDLVAAVVAVLLTYLGHAGALKRQAKKALQRSALDGPQSTGSWKLNAEEVLAKTISGKLAGSKRRFKAIRQAADDQ